MASGYAIFPQTKSQRRRRFPLDHERIFRNREFESVFAAYFDSDLIDADNTEDILDLADTVVFYALPRKVAAAEIVDSMEYALAHWGPEVIEEFEATSNFPWAGQARYENLLKSVAERMLSAAQAEQAKMLIIKNSEPPT